MIVYVRYDTYAARVKMFLRFSRHTAGDLLSENRTIYHESPCGADIKSWGLSFFHDAFPEAVLLEFCVCFLERFRRFFHRVEVGLREPLDTAGHFAQAFFERSSDFEFERKDEKKENYHSHNLFLQLSSESGLPAALILLMIYFVILFKGIIRKVKNKPLHPGVISALLAFFIYSLFDSTYNARFTHASMFHINLIVLMLLVKLYADSEEAEKENMER